MVLLPFWPVGPSSSSFPLSGFTEGDNVVPQVVLFQVGAKPLHTYSKVSACRCDVATGGCDSCLGSLWGQLGLILIVFSFFLVLGV